MEYTVRNHTGHTFLENATKEQVLSFFEEYQPSAFRVGGWGITFLGWVYGQDFVHNPEIFRSKNMKVVK